MLEENASQTYVTAGEVSSLEHELRNYTVELGSLVVFAIGATSGNGCKVLGGFWDNIGEEGEVNTAGLL
jgi:hypothetical protein